MLCSPGCPGRQGGEAEKQCLSTGLVRVHCVDMARVMSAGSWSVTERNCPISRPLIVVIAYRVHLISSSADVNHKLTAVQESYNKLASILWVKCNALRILQSLYSQCIAYYVSTPQKSITT